MDGWEWSKIGTAVTAAVTVMLSGYWFAGELTEIEYPERRGYRVEGVAPVDLASLQRSWPTGLVSPAAPATLRGYMGNIEKAVLSVPAGGTATAAPAAPVDLGTLLAAADPARGESIARVCASCHTFEQGGPHRVGPNLWPVVGRPVADKPGYAYSRAIVDHGGVWSYEELDRYLASPARAIPGNKMAFNGIRNPRDRAHLLAYLGSLGGARLPYPAPAPTAAAAAGPNTSTP